MESSKKIDQPRIVSAGESEWECERLRGQEFGAPGRRAGHTAVPCCRHGAHPVAVQVSLRV